MVKAILQVLGVKADQLSESSPLESMVSHKKSTQIRVRKFARVEISCLPNMFPLRGKIICSNQADWQSFVSRHEEKGSSGNAAITVPCSAHTHGSTVRVAYQGVSGAYSEAAAHRAYPNCVTVPCEQFEDVFEAVEYSIADGAVLPFENSLGGSIHRNYDLLLRHCLHIVGEVLLPVHHCLLALPGVRKDELTRVISHPQALSQCEFTLTKMDLDVVREPVDGTAGAAKFIAVENLHDTAAIASERAAKLYGLNILAEGIQDDSRNATRFLILARTPIIPRTEMPFRTSIVFSHDDHESISTLFKVLSAFAVRNISFTKLESRPNANRPIRLVDDVNGGAVKRFQYMHYIDFEASMADGRAQEALAEAKEFTSFLRVLGSYPIDTSL